MCNPVSTAYPEFLLAKGVHAGYEWEVTNNGIGYRCGYVRVPYGHPWHGLDYDAIDARVHGGLTFAEPDTHCGKGGADNAWWIGFDCAHAGDGADPELPARDGYSVRRYDFLLKDPVRTTEYVAAECRRLAEQARNHSQQTTGSQGR